MNETRASIESAVLGVWVISLVGLIYTSVIACLIVLGLVEKRKTFKCEHPGHKGSMLLLGVAICEMIYFIFAFSAASLRFEARNVICDVLTQMQPQVWVMSKQFLYV